MNVEPSQDQPLCPRDLATMLLASGDLLPRQRARDQQADIAGGTIKRRVLERLAEIDPEPEDLGATLERIVQEIGQPAGPTRAIASGIHEEFEAARQKPELLAWLIEQAAARSVQK